MKIRSASSSVGKLAAIPASVRDPWQISADDFPSDGTPDEQLWVAVSYAVLAPSTHNTQPWRFFINDKTVDLLADPSRGLPVVDPQGRELVISCGAALFYLRLALRYFGFCPEVEILPEATRSDWLARVHMGARTEVDADTVLLFQAIPWRRTHRQRFGEESVPAALLMELAEEAQAEGAWLRVVEEEGQREALANLVAEGDRRQWADRHFRKELAAWIRPADRRGNDGLSVATQDLGSVMSHAGPLVIRTFDLGKGHAARDHEIAVHSPVLAVLGTERDDEAAWLAAGQALAQLLLRAQGENVAASFLNQPIEVPELRPAVTDLLGSQGFPQLVLRMGYADATPHTPRRPVRDVVSVKAGS